MKKQLIAAMCLLVGSMMPVHADEEMVQTMNEVKEVRKHDDVYVYGFISHPTSLEEAKKTAWLLFIEALDEFINNESDDPLVINRPDKHDQSVHEKWYRKNSYYYYCVYVRKTDVIPLDEADLIGAPIDQEELARRQQEEFAAAMRPATKPVEEVAPAPIAKAEPKPIVEPAPVAKAEPKPIVEPVPVVKAEPKPIVEPAPVVKEEPKAEVKPAPVVKEEPKAEVAKVVEEKTETGAAQTVEMAFANVATDLTPFELEMMDIRVFDYVKPFVVQLVMDGKVNEGDYGKYKTRPNADCYHFVYNQSGNIVAHLRQHNGHYYSMEEGREVLISQYSGCGTFWFKLK